MTGTVEYRLGTERAKLIAPRLKRLTCRRLLRRGSRDWLPDSGDGMLLRRRWIFIVAMRLNTPWQCFHNLTRDHLDYHKTMENYWYAKQRLFDGRLGSRPTTSVINVDDPYGVELAERLEKRRAARRSLRG